MKYFFAVVFMLTLVAFPYSSMSAKEDGVVVLTSDNTLVLNDEVNGESVSTLISQAKKLANPESGGLSKLMGSKSKGPMYLFLNTPGGEIQTGLELIEALNGLNRKVDTITLFAASMGFQIAQNLGTRHILQNGTLMSHRARGGFKGEFGGESPSQLDSRYNFWKARIEEMDKKTVSRTNGKQTLESYQHQYNDEMWLTGNQSVEQGYADKVTKVKCDASLTGTTSHEALIMGMFKVNYQLDKCPINTSPMDIKVGILTTKGYMDSEEFVTKGGIFGFSCLTDSTAKDKLCALDTSLNIAKIVEIKNQFKTQYEAKSRQVVDRF